MTDYLQRENSFTELSRIYDQTGMSAWSAEAAPAWLRYLQESGWLGRHVLEFGCGTGLATQYLSQMRLAVTAIDTSEEMLAHARHRMKDSSYSVELALDDMRVYNSGEKKYDLVLAIDTINYLSNVRYLNAVLQRANTVLKMGKVLMFDMWTIEGLAVHHGRGAQILHDEDGVFLTVRNQFSYDSYRLHKYYTFFYEAEGNWHRAEEEYVLRGYPVSALTSMLNRAGFEIRALLDGKLTTYDEAQDITGRLVVVAEKAKEPGA